MSHHSHAELVRLAQMVHSMRSIQRAYGAGYKTPGAKTEAEHHERKVDAEVARILKNSGG